MVPLFRLLFPLILDFGFWFFNLWKNALREKFKKAKRCVSWLRSKTFMPQKPKTKSWGLRRRETHFPSWGRRTHRPRGRCPKILLIFLHWMAKTVSGGTGSSLISRGGGFFILPSFFLYFWISDFYFGNISKTVGPGQKPERLPRSLGQAGSFDVRTIGWGLLDLEIEGGTNQPPTQPRNN